MAWEEALEAVEEQLEQMLEQQASARQALERITAEIAKMDAVRAEQAELERRVKQLVSEQNGEDEDLQRLAQRIEEANRLIANAEQIKQAYERAQALSKERDALDHQRDVVRGLEKQQEHIKDTMKERQMAEEQRLRDAQASLQSDERTIAELDRQLLEQVAVKVQRDAALKATKTLAQLEAKRKAHEEATSKAEASFAALEQEKKGLEGQRILLLDQIAKEAAHLQPVAQAAAALKDAEATVERRRKLQEQMEVVKHEGQELAEAIKERSGQLSGIATAAAKLARNRKEVAETKDGACPTCGSELTPLHRTKVLEQFDVQLAEQAQLRLDTEAWITNSEASRAELRRQFVALKADVEQLESAQEQWAAAKAALDTANEKATALAEKHQKAKALAQQIDQRQFGFEHRDAYRSAKQHIAEIAFDANAYESMRRKADQLERLEQEVVRLEEVRGRKEQLGAQLTPQKTRLAAIRRELDAGTMFVSYREKLARLADQLARVGFDHARFEQVRKELTALSRAGERFQQLFNAQENKAEWDEQAKALTQRKTERMHTIEALQTRVNACQKQLQAAEDLAQQRAGQQEAMKTLEATIAVQQQQRGQWQERLAKAEAERKEIRSLRKKQREHKSKEVLYTQLRKAFGRTGIPSLIIEQTLPEIEDRANELLHRLSDGRMHVSLETQRDLKTGGTKETLDIKITDEQGISRPYETFSGGEAFRVNFSLRIALAQLLAERSGVRVRTLVIDEGFGTQDAQGVENMVEAIQVVKEDFDKIMVITHLNQLKEAFPVRIQVRKDAATGSTFEVLGV